MCENIVEAIKGFPKMPSDWWNSLPSLVIGQVIGQVIGYIPGPREDHVPTGHNPPENTGGFLDEGRDVGEVGEDTEDGTTERKEEGEGGIKDGGSEEDLEADGSQDESGSSLTFSEDDPPSQNLGESNHANENISPVPGTSGPPPLGNGGNNYTIHVTNGSFVQIGDKNKILSKKQRGPGLDYTDESSENSDNSDTENTEHASGRRHRRRQNQVRGQSRLHRPGTSSDLDTIDDSRSAQENSYRTESVRSESSFGSRSIGSSRHRPEPEVPGGSHGQESGDEDEAPCNLHIDVDEEMFYGREEEMEQLAKLLKKKKKAGISGIGGAGKTTFVSLYALKNKKRYKDAILYVDASLTSTLHVEYAKLAGPDVLNLIQHPTKNIEKSMSLVMNWLMNHKRYLLIFDAADHEKNLRMLGSQQPKGHRFIPPIIKLRGHVIITSQCPQEAFQNVQIMTPMVLGDLDEERSCSFLSKRVYHDEADSLVINEEKQSLEDLVSGYLPGCLPIYLEQTAAYIRGKNTTFIDYLDDLKTTFRERNPINGPCYGDNTKSVDVTFQANFKALEEKSVEAFCLLKMAALCHSKDIPLSLFTIGSIALMRGDVKVTEEFGDLQILLLEKMNPDDSDPIKPAGDKGIRAARELLNVSRESQFVKYKRGATEFTVHEVIQQQLRLLMKERGEIQSSLEILAQILLFMLTSDDLPLSEKRQYLSHAEACARHMETFDIEHRSYKHLILRLRIKTAHVFTSLGSYSTAVDIISEVERKMPDEGAEAVIMELTGLKASVYLHKGMPQKALELGKDALDFGLYSLDIDTNAKAIAFELALIRKTYAETLLTMFDNNSEEVENQLTMAKKSFEYVEQHTTINCQNHIAHLIMLQGVLHQRKGDQYRMEKLSQDLAQKEFGLAILFFMEASKVMDPESVFMDVTQVYLVETSLKLRLKPSQDQLLEALDKLHSSRQSLEKKVTREHQLVAWVLEKIARLQVDVGLLQQGLSLLDEAQEILKEVYPEERDGLVLKGQNICARGKALFIKKDILESKVCFGKALELLRTIPNHPDLRLADAHIRVINRWSAT